MHTTTKERLFRVAGQLLQPVLVSPVAHIVTSLEGVGLNWSGRGASGLSLGTAGCFPPPSLPTPYPPPSYPLPPTPCSGRRTSIADELTAESPRLEEAYQPVFPRFAASTAASPGPQAHSHAAPARAPSAGKPRLMTSPAMQGAPSLATNRGLSESKEQ